MALEVLRQRYATLVEPEEIARGLAKASLPGRLEKLAEQPLLLLDGAHNVDSMRELIKTVKSTYTYQRLIMVAAMMKDKEIESIVPLMVRDCAQLITTAVQDQARSLTAEQLADYAAQWLSREQIQSYPTIAKALQAAREMAKKEDLILVTGSLYLVAEARLLLTESNDEYI
jgi:dihydrofolate synthase/folylpolyglutamate synthase